MKKTRMALNQCFPKCDCIAVVECEMILGGTQTKLKKLCIILLCIKTYNTISPYLTPLLGSWNCGLKTYNEINFAIS